MIKSFVVGCLASVALSMQTFEPMVSEIMDKAIRIVENGA